METIKYKTALIVGAGEGLSASLARLFTREGIRVALAARQTAKLAALCKETGATAYACDATSLDDVTRLFAGVELDGGAPDVVVYNASGRMRGVFVDLIPADVAQAIAVSAFGGFLVAQEAFRAVAPTHGHGDSDSAPTNTYVVAQLAPTPRRRPQSAQRDRLADPRGPLDGRDGRAHLPWSAAG